MREADVAGLLGHVDLHDPLQQRVHVVARAQDRLLHVVDRLLAGQHAVEEAERDDPCGQRQDRADDAEDSELPPGTSWPERFTNSWNIWVWWHSSVASCVA